MKLAQPLVLYHADCNDGFCAAWVTRQAMPNAEFVPVQYGQEPPPTAGRRVYILDFSYPRETMLAIAKDAEFLFVGDHHKTANDALAGFALQVWDDFQKTVFVHFDMEKSGGRLAWEHFFPGKPSPWLVEYTEDRDLWRWKLLASKEVSAALASYPRDFELWDDLDARGIISNSPPDTLVAEGRAILRYQSQVVDSLCSKASEIELDGHKVLCVNATTLISEVAGKLAEGRPFGVTWFEDANGDRIYSLRSRGGGVDVSEIAKKHGGGGHRNAAGFKETPKAYCQRCSYLAC